MKKKQTNGAQRFTDRHALNAPVPLTDGSAQDKSGSQNVSEPTDLFKLVYRLVEDLQRVRLAHGNRIRQVLPLLPASVKPPRPFSAWGAFFAASVDTLETEEQRILRLAERLVKENPVGEWLLDQHGIGPALAVSILGECWPLTRFKSPRCLWAYAGLHVGPEGKAVRRAKGQKANWSGRLKTRLWVFTTSVIKTGGPWRTLYDQRKAYEVSKTPVSAQNTVSSQSEFEPDTPRAGAQTGDDRHTTDAPSGERGDAQTSLDGHIRGALSKLHIHNRAIRFVQKALLKDLWRVAHGQPPVGCVGTLGPSFQISDG